MLLLVNGLETLIGPYIHQIVVRKQQARTVFIGKRAR